MLGKHQELIMDTALYTMLFVLLASPMTVNKVRSFLLPSFNNRTAIHGVVFAIMYVIIQKILKRV